MAAGLGLTVWVRQQRGEGEMADVPRSPLSARDYLPVIHQAMLHQLDAAARAQISRALNGLTDATQRPQGGR